MRPITPEGRRFGRRLRSWREAAGLSGRELARRARCSSAFACQLEQGCRTASEAVARRLAAAVTVPVEEVLAAAGLVPAVIVRAFRRAPDRMLCFAAVILHPLRATPEPPEDDSAREDE